MRYVIPVGALAVIIGVLVVIKVKQFSVLAAANEAGMKAGPPPEAVGTAVAKQDTWEQTLSAVGTVAAVRGVMLSAEVPGVVKAIRFESGQRVAAGQVLVELDTSVERAQLASAEARRDLANVGHERTQKLAQMEAVSKAQVDTDQAQLKSSTAERDALKAQIDRKTVRAPFAGRLGIRQVNLGQYLNPGAPVAVLESLGSVYVDFTLPQQHLQAVKPGAAVRVNAGGVELSGTVGAVDPAVDPITRTIKLRASVPDKEEKLRPGMFVQVAVVRPEKATVVTAPATAVVHASYGDSVFVVENGKARQQFVRLGQARGDFVAILDGVKAGQELVTAGAFKLRNGAAVMVNNDIQPAPSLQPRVDNL